MLFEFVLPCVAGAAPFTPVKGEILQLLQGEGPGYAVEALQKLKHVFTGLEIRGQGLALTAGRAGRGGPARGFRRLRCAGSGSRCLRGPGGWGRRHGGVLRRCGRCGSGHWRRGGQR